MIAKQRTYGGLERSDCALGSNRNGFLLMSFIHSLVWDECLLLPRQSLCVLCCKFCHQMESTPVQGLRAQQVLYMMDGKKDPKIQDRCKKAVRGSHVVYLEAESDLIRNN